MTTLPERVLLWLYNSLKPQYRNVDRTYSDVAQALQRHTTLSPRTDVHTFDNGSSALLLVLQGTLPVRFRGTEYQFPIAVWIPYSYPQEPPLVFVPPTPDMSIRAGQHVSGEGRIYHPYLASWGNHWDKSNLIDLLRIVADIFTKEPPVVAQQQRPLPQSGSQTAPQTQVAQSQSVLAAQAQNSGPAPPPRPSKINGPAPESSPAQAPSSDVPSAAPPRPPKPAQQPLEHRYSTAAPLPPRYGALFANDAGPHHAQVRPNLAQARPVSLYDIGQQPPPRDERALWPAFNQIQAPVQQPPNNQAPVPQRATSLHQPARSGSYAQPPTLSQPTLNAIQQPALQPQRKRQPMPDLLSDSIEAILPAGSASSMPAPPIPPNPEKDALLHAISDALVAQAAQIIAQNEAAIPSLQAQSVAMQQAEQGLAAELAQLQALDATLASNERILHAAMRDAEAMSDGVKSKQLPSVDEVLVAPTVVGQQLYALVADLQAVGDAMFALARAHDRGRVSADVYIKQTRSLAREQFLQKALIRKVARGMGLTGDGF